MRTLWRALALAWLGGIASPGLADDSLQPETAIEVGQPDGDDEALDDAAELLAPRPDAGR
jgi:hypothetical protein